MLNLSYFLENATLCRRPEKGGKEYSDFNEIRNSVTMECLVCLWKIRKINIKNWLDETQNSGVAFYLDESVFPDNDSVDYTIASLLQLKESNNLTVLHTTVCRNYCNRRTVRS